MGVTSYESGNQTFWKVDIRVRLPDGREKPRKTNKQLNNRAERAEEGQGRMVFKIGLERFWIIDGIAQNCWECPASRSVRIY